LRVMSPTSYQTAPSRINEVTLYALKASNTTFIQYIYLKDPLNYPIHTIFILYALFSSVLR
ncbi:MAG: hypothetical protein L0G93_18560, partial [Acinetobacter sp.]|nr:hypothetical protein [Acinetobacter sp.]